MLLDASNAWIWLIGCIILVALFLALSHTPCAKQKVPVFYSWIGAIAAFGGALAIILPVALNSGFGPMDDGRVLRQLILYTTGGVLGVVTLGETHRKNNIEKEKNKNDHIRQVHAERRSRYAKAIEQLAGEKAAVRLGGIYTLMGLVDEWLADDTLGPEEQKKEGQVIVNNLCSYIRSPFPLALKAEMIEGDSEPDNYEGDFSKDQAAFREEQDVRRTIFAEMSKRSSTFGEDEAAGPDVWSNFDFDFSRAPIFYPLNGLTIEKGNFSSAKFYSNADFKDTTFNKDAVFRRAIFTQTADFREATFIQDANMTWATFTQTAKFTGTNFMQIADFWRATFTQTAEFRSAAFAQTAEFRSAAFAQDTSFSKAIFTQSASFKRGTFTKNADFSGAIFNQKTDFSETTFEESSPKFVDVTKDPDKTFRARFVALPKDQEAHNFTVSDSSFPIPLGRARLDGVEYRIPVGTALFDPSSGETSHPAKPLDKSTDGEEDEPE